MPDMIPITNVMSIINAMELLKSQKNNFTITVVAFCKAKITASKAMTTAIIVNFMRCVLVTFAHHKFTQIR